METGGKTIIILLKSEEVCMEKSGTCYVQEAKIREQEFEEGTDWI